MYLNQAVYLMLSLYCNPNLLPIVIWWDINMHYASMVMEVKHFILKLKKQNTISRVLSKLNINFMVHYHTDACSNPEYVMTGMSIPYIYSTYRGHQRWNGSRGILLHHLFSTSSLYSVSTLELYLNSCYRWWVVRLCHWYLLPAVLV